MPNQSGEKNVRSNKSSKRGSPYLRKALFNVMTCYLQKAPADEPVFQFLDRKRAEGKPYYVYMTAGANKFLRRYYGKVMEYLSSLEDLPPQMMCVEPEDRAITGAVMELPDKYKQVVLLYYFQGLTQRETAQALGLTPSAVVRRLRAAEARLRQALMGGEADEE